MDGYLRRIPVMRNSTARWTTAAAAAALLALPLTASAQTTPPTTAPQQVETKPAPDQAPAKDAKTDPAAAKQHLSEARDTLSQLTSLPEAARLQGDTRTQVTQVISAFNELITTQSDWRSAYAKVDAGLTAVLGPETQEPPPSSSTSGAVGTAGSTAAALDPAVRAK